MFVYTVCRDDLDSCDLVVLKLFQKEEDAKKESAKWSDTEVRKMEVH